jgi:transposase InsO family protein
MHTHPNARLTPVSRERLVRRHIQDAEPLAHLAALAGVRLRTVYKWLSRYRCGGAAALVDRRSVRRSQRRTLDPQHLQRAFALRHERCTLRRIARLLALPLSTVGRTLKAMGLGRQKHLQPPVPVRRYQWARPGDMIHVDIKQLTQFKRVGHRITGDRRLGRSAGSGYGKAHLAIDDATRLAYAEVLPDEKQATTVGFLIRAVAWFGRQGIESRRVLSDNGSAYRSKPWRQACEALGLSAKRTRPYTPRTKGKAERFIKTLVNEWAYGLSFQSSEERNRWLGRYLAIYNGRRCHMALSGRTPFEQLELLRATE